MQRSFANEGIDEKKLSFRFPLFRNYSLKQDEVHLWCVNLSLLGNRNLQQLSGYLSKEEFLRTERYYFDKDKRLFVFRSGLLRRFLGSYLHVSPSKVQIGYNGNGKPFLNDHHGEDTIQFSLSHSKGVVLYGFSRKGRIGVDVELIQPMTDMDDVVEGFFSKNEKIEYKGLSIEHRMEGFYNCWTRKEAFLKALGDGLSRGLDTFDVSLTPGEPAVLKRVGWAPTEVQRWMLQSITTIPGYAAAIAVEGNDWSLKYTQLTYDHLLKYLSGES